MRDEHPHSASAVPLVRWFKDLSLVDDDLVGGKAANLGELTSAGLPVPDGFALTAAAYLEPARPRPNLVVRGGAHAARVLLEGRRAIGVELAGGEVLRAGEVAHNQDHMINRTSGWHVSLRSPTPPNPSLGVITEH